MSDRVSASGGELADMLVYLSRLGQSSAHCGAADATRATLTSAQWTALRYFARANRFSRTPSAFSNYHATTRGTASQTLKSLVNLGLLERRSHAIDGRSTVMEVTPQGQDMLRHDPMVALQDALDTLPPETRTTVADALGQVIFDLAQDRNAPIFGTCVDCSHCEQSAAGTYCQCTQSALTRPEMHTLCIDFQPSRRPG